MKHFRHAIWFWNQSFSYMSHLPKWKIAMRMIFQGKLVKFVWVSRND